MNQTNDITLKIKSLLPKCQKLASVKPDAELSQAMNKMIRNNYSQLPVIDTFGRLKGVVSWKTIGEFTADFRSPISKLVRDCMDTSVKAIHVDSSLFDVMAEIEKRDYIVVKDSNNKIKGIVTASDLANGFEGFSRAFAYLGEIDLGLRNFAKSKGVSVKKRNDPSKFLGIPDYAKRLECKRDVFEHLVDLDSLISEIQKVTVIRDEVMHFKNGKLEATECDLKTLEKHKESIVNRLAPRD